MRGRPTARSVGSTETEEREKHAFRPEILFSHLNVCACVLSRLPKLSVLAKGAGHDQGKRVPLLTHPSVLFLCPEMNCWNWVGCCFCTCFCFVISRRKCWNKVFKRCGSVLLSFHLMKWKWQLQWVLHKVWTIMSGMWGSKVKGRFCTCKVFLFGVPMRAVCAWRGQACFSVHQPDALGPQASLLAFCPVLPPAWHSRFFFLCPVWQSPPQTPPRPLPPFGSFFAIATSCLLSC